MSHGEIRIGVVGLRFGREVHVPAFRSLAGCRVVALAGTNAGRAAAAAAEMPGVRGYGSWRDMLAAGGIDAVSIAVPPSAQAEIAVAAAESGLAVFCDKPAAADVSQAEAMLGAVRRHGVAHAINFLFPEIPAWRAARAALGDLAAGRPLRQAALTWRVETYAHRHDLRDGWKRSAAAGGGVLSMFVSHSIYYLEWLFGPLRSVLARLLPSADDDAHVTAWLDFDSGLHATLDVAMNCPFGSGHRLEVYGHEGGLVLANSAADYARGFELQVQSRGPSPPQVPETIPGTDDGRIWATARIAERFLRRIRQGGDGGPDLHDGLRVQRILEAIQASHRTGHWVEAPRSDDRT